MNHIRPSASLPSLLFLSEKEVRRCLPIAAAIEASRKALGSLRLRNDGGAVVPTRIGLPYQGKGADDTADGVKPPVDWTLFKPAAYYPNASDPEGNVLMGMKLVSVRAGNPAIGKPTVPATIMLVDAPTGEVCSVMGGTYLTAARTAAGSAIATDICTRYQHNRPIQLVVFGAGLQAECHINAILAVKEVEKLTIVNRTLKRAEELKVLISSREEHEANEGINKGMTFLKASAIDIVLLDDDAGVQLALGEADVICTTTNTATPLFSGEWVKPGCHLNGIGSYTHEMEEVDSRFILQRCRVIVDTKEALDVGDLKAISLSSSNFSGLLGDHISGNTRLDEQRGGSELDCTFFKSVGTAIQDVITANTAFEAARQQGVGTNILM